MRRRPGNDTTYRPQRVVSPLRPAVAPRE